MTIIAVDFDETLCCRSNPNNILFQALIERQKQGCKIILNTCRNGERLNEAVDFCKHHGLLFDAVNSNLPFVIKWLGYDPRKIFASIYLDDKNINIQKFINDSFLENRSINLVTKTGHVCSAQELRYYSELKARKHEYRNADDYIQDPETGLMQGRRPSGNSGGGFGGGEASGDSGLTIGQTNDTINGKLKEIIEAPEKLGVHTPAEWKQVMIDEGRKVTPLMDGNFRGVPFEAGGGYKTNFEDGGLFMYHPA